MDVDGEGAGVSPVTLKGLFSREEIKLQLRLAEAAKTQVCSRELIFSIDNPSH